MSEKFVCPECGSELEEIVECGTYWDYINVKGDTVSRKKAEVEFYFCPECNADITSAVNEWFKREVYPHIPRAVGDIS